MGTLGTLGLLVFTWIAMRLAGPRLDGAGGQEWSRANARMVTPGWELLLWQAGLLAHRLEHER